VNFCARFKDYSLIAMCFSPYYALVTKASPGFIDELGEWVRIISDRFRKNHTRIKELGLWNTIPWRGYEALRNDVISKRTTFPIFKYKQNEMVIMEINNILRAAGIPVTRSKKADKEEEEPEPITKNCISCGVQFKGVDEHCTCCNID
jgi:hypothetical protein